jgi:hypothetical protein
LRPATDIDLFEPGIATDLSVKLQALDAVNEPDVDLARELVAPRPDRAVLPAAGWGFSRTMTSLQARGDERRGRRLLR